MLADFAPAAEGNVALVGPRAACTAAFAELTGVTARVVVGLRVSVARNVAIWDAGSVPSGLAKLYLAECDGILVVGGLEELPGLLESLPASVPTALVGPELQRAPENGVASPRRFASGRGWGPDLTDAVAWLSAHRPPRYPDRKLSSLEARFLEWVQGDGSNDEDFLESVDDGTVAPWDHRAHLRVAWLASLSGDPHAGMAIACDRIRRAVEAGAGRSGAEFHATMTYFWVRLVQAALFASPGAGVDFCTFLLLHPMLFHGGLWRSFYSSDRLFSSAAAACVVSPDLAPLPAGHRRTVECGDAEGTLVKKGRRRCTRGASLRDSR